jgi:probable addiction module antidote protein
MSSLKLRPFNMEDYLRDEESCQLLLDEVLEDGDPRLIAEAIGAIARWRGMAKVAEESGLARESLYRSLSSEGNPTLDTLLRVCDVLGIDLELKIRKPNPAAG